MCERVGSKDETKVTEGVSGQGGLGDVLETEIGPMENF